jgi:hypothetical protein
MSGYTQKSISGYTPHNNMSRGTVPVLLDRCRTLSLKASSTVREKFNKPFSVTRIAIGSCPTSNLGIALEVIDRPS